MLGERQQSTNPQEPGRDALPAGRSSSTFPEAEVTRIPGMNRTCLIVHGWVWGFLSTRTVVGKCMWHLHRCRVIAALAGLGVYGVFVVECWMQASGTRSACKLPEFFRAKGSVLLVGTPSPKPYRREICESAGVKLGVQSEAAMHAMQQERSTTFATAWTRQRSCCHAGPWPYKP